MSIPLIHGVIKERLIEAEVVEHPATKEIAEEMLRSPRPALDVPPELARGGGGVVPEEQETPPFIRQPEAVPYAALIEAAVGQDPPWYEAMARSQVLESNVRALTGVKAVASVRRADTEVAELGLQATPARFDEFGEIGVSTGVRAAERAMSVAEEMVSSEVTRALATPLSGSQLESLARRHNISTAGVSVPDSFEATTAVRPFPKAGQGSTSRGQVLRFPNVVPRIMTNMRAAILP